MGRRWLFPVCLIALLSGGGGLLCHTGVVHRISNQDQLIDLLRGGGWTGALLCGGIPEHLTQLDRPSPTNSAGKPATRHLSVN